MLGNGGNIKDASIFFMFVTSAPFKDIWYLQPLAVENIYISKTFWLSGSIQLDVVREHQANKLAVREINLLESNLTLLYLFGLQDP